MFETQKIAVYARSSTEAPQDACLAEQLRRCRRFVVNNGGSVHANRIFIDATSGPSRKRPGLDALKHAVATKTIDVIVVTDLSRISRNFRELAAISDLADVVIADDGETR